VCGITGWVDWDADLTQRAGLVQAMTDTMECRGPDADGVWLSTRAALGHRRLAVIDPVGGAQPMVEAPPVDGHPGTSGGATGSVVLTFSGEVYNFRELRAELAAAGHRFRTRSDTEVVLRAYLEWGAGCLRRFTGMFAFAVWDEDRQELLLARDPLGVKPLYYADTGHGVLFGSEPKAVLANPLFAREVDDEGLCELLVTPTLRTPGHGVFRGLREVRPGRVVCVGRAGVRESAYWTLESAPHTTGLDATARRVRELLEHIVAQQVVADVPLCALLSGGLDSSAVTALAARSLAGHTDEKLATFSMDYRDSERTFVPDELRPTLDSPYALAVADHVGTRHIEVMLDTPDLMAEQMTTMAARDLPGMGDLDVSLYVLFREVRWHSTVALSGESADEVFGGYPWFHDDAALDTAAGFPWTHGRRDGRYDVFAPDLMRRLKLGDYVRDRYLEALREVPYLAGEQGRDRRLREAFYLSLTRFLPALLERKDRMSMAASLEVRVPFCDHRLVQYLWNVPWSIKNADGMEKGLLRRAVADLLPPTVVRRRKSAFPVARSPAYDAALRLRLRQVLADPDSPLRPMLDPVALGEVLAAPAPSGVWNGPCSTAWLSYLVELDTWLRGYRVTLR